MPEQVIEYAARLSRTGLITSYLYRIPVCSDPNIPCNCQAVVLGPVNEYVRNRSRLACSVDSVLQGLSVL